MPGRYREVYSTPEVLAAQAHYFGRQKIVPPQPERDPLTAEEMEFIGRRDSFYMGTVTSNGWPYVQHRGGRPGFLRVLGPSALAFADYQGNRQMLSTGNIAANHRVALFLIDYPRQERLKILGQARVEDARVHPELVEQLAEAEDREVVERLVFIDVISFDWNCSQYIIPRYTDEDIRKLVQPLRERIAELESRLGR